LTIVFLLTLTLSFTFKRQKGALGWWRLTAIEKAIKPNFFLLKTVAQSTSPEPYGLRREILVSYILVTWLLGRLEQLAPNWSKLVVFSTLAYVLTRGFGEVSLLITVLILLLFSATRQFFGFRLAWVKQRVVILSALSAQILSILWCNLFGLTGSCVGGKAVTFFYQQYLVRDLYSVVSQNYLLLCTFIFLIVTFEYLLKYSIKKKINLIEFPLVIGFALFFMLLLVSSFNMFGAYVSLEGLTFSLYILAGMNYNSQNSMEAGIKYFCLGALSSGILLFGIALVFIMTKTLAFLELRFLFNTLNTLPVLLSFALIFIFFGFWFKLSIFPCHG
jgi:NADH:ubiquinone oxidoreductase subunit 2 (subunit N)